MYIYLLMQKISSLETETSLPHLPPTFPTSQLVKLGVAQREL